MVPVNVRIGSYLGTQRLEVVTFELRCGYMPDSRAHRLNRLNAWQSENFIEFLLKASFKFLKQCKAILKIILVFWLTK